jgi:hypothetical protein
VTAALSSEACTRTNTMDDANLKETLSGAFDVSSLFDVFQKMAGVIKEQQGKIDAANGKISALKREIKSLPAPGSGGENERDEASLAALQEMQQKLADMHNYVHGTGGSVEDTSGLALMKSQNPELLATAPSATQYIAKLNRSANSKFYTILFRPPATFAICWSPKVL